MSAKTVSAALCHSLGVLELVVEFHQCCLVATSVAVVWRAENRHHVLVVAPVVTLHRNNTALTVALRATCDHNYVYSGGGGEGGKGVKITGDLK